MGRLIFGVAIIIILSSGAYYNFLFCRDFVNEGDDKIYIVHGRIGIALNKKPFSILFFEIDNNASRRVLESFRPAFSVVEGFDIGLNIYSGYRTNFLITTKRCYSKEIILFRENTAIISTTDPHVLFKMNIRFVDEHIVEVELKPVNARNFLLLEAYFKIDENERFLGFGERSDGADQTGRIVENWCEEGPFSPGALERITALVFGDRWQGPWPLPGTNFPMPWFISSKGYGFLLNTTHLNVFEMGAIEKGRWSVFTTDRSMRFYLFLGPKPADVLRRFTDFVGRQPEPAPWFFGVWYQPFGKIKGEEDYIFWRKRNVPITVVQTYTHYLPAGDHIGKDERAFVENYHRWGYKVTTYVNCFVAEDHKGGAYSYGVKNKFFIMRKDGEPYSVYYIAYPKSRCGIVDFTNPEAVRWWQNLVYEAIENGYDGWMEDFGEYVPPDALSYDGKLGLELHNLYPVLYHKASHELTWKIKGRDFAQFVRSGYLGVAPYARIVWGGDPSTDYSKADGLAAAISQGLSLGLSGISYWGSDIGGFHSITQPPTDAELLIRWIQFGAFSGIMRTQAEGWPIQLVSMRAQVWSDEVLPVWIMYARLRTQLFPYIWNCSLEYQRTGMPIMRHLSLMFDDDPNIYHPLAEYEYMFGPNILVAPIIEEGARERVLYLPRGRWVYFWDAVEYDEHSGFFIQKNEFKVLEGGKFITVKAPLDKIPLFVRSGTILRLLHPDIDTLADIECMPEVLRLKDCPDKYYVLYF